MNEDALGNIITEIEKNPRRLGNGIFYRVKRNGHYEMLDVSSKEFADYMKFYMYEHYKINVSSNLLESTSSILRGKYGDSLALKSLYNRVGKAGNAIYFDIQNQDSKEFQYVKISETGWQMVDDTNVSFSWNQLSSPQCIPEKGDISLICKYFNLDDNNMLQTMVYMVALFVPDIQYPILNVSGEHGSGKSTVCKILKSLCDPSEEKLSGLTHKEDDLILSLWKNHVTVYDNVERMLDKFNATLCKAVTGGQFSKRKLYTDSDQVLLTLKSAIIINGISSVVKQEDLLSRVLFVNMKSNEGFADSPFESENSLMDKFKMEKAQILGGIFEILAKAMRIFPTVRIETPFRLKDYAKWGYAIAEAIEEGLGDKFLCVLEENSKIQLQETYLNQPLVGLIYNYMTVNKKDCIEKTTQGFYHDISQFASNSTGIYAKKDVPSTSAVFVKKINSYQSIFHKLGLDIKTYRSRDKANISYICVKKMDNEKNERCTRIPVTGIRKAIVGIRQAVV